MTFMKEPWRYRGDKLRMQEKLRQRVWMYALHNRHREKWKSVSYALAYGASLWQLFRNKELMT